MVLSVDEELEPALRDSKGGRLFNIFQNDKSSILIANHQLYTDWIYMWTIAKLQRLDGNVKIILKASLQKIPIFGWGMEFLEFIFLKRNWDKDQNTLISSMNRIKTKMYPTLLILFPEGTTLSLDGRKKSLEYSEKNNLKDFKYLLHPRSTGLFFCLTQLRESIDYVYDLTFGFPGIDPKQFKWPEDFYSLKNMFGSRIYPKSISVHIRRFHVSTIPSDKGAFTEWLNQRYEEKDQLLTQFYTNGHFTPHKKSKNSISVPPMSPFEIFSELAVMWSIFFSAVYIIKHFML
ncbi:hypothetical protein BB560_004525 [Smittium megazygosporum]|uniref:Phospholipid/glycerol acyltransferase domain-containing protein n=1 Tax=Smittium megazygosporum TaxID=133381 RepID=A0A2T9Z945_9FUNG|nr:hypothetical protein BB560_004525 [Smittium megazygosporum]